MLLSQIADILAVLTIPAIIISIVEFFQNRKLERDVKVLREITDAEIRLGKDKRGKLVKRADGSYGIDWKLRA